MPSAYLLMWFAPWILFLVRILVGYRRIGMVEMAPDVENPDKFDQILSDTMGNHLACEQNRAIRRRHLRFITGEYAPTLKGGGRRPAWDLQLCASSWGLCAAACPDGEGSYDSLARDGDMNVTVATPNKATGLIPNAELLLSPGDAHISLVRKKADEIVAASSSMFDEHVV